VHSKIGMSGFLYRVSFAQQAAVLVSLTERPQAGWTMHRLHLPRTAGERRTRHALSGDATGGPERAGRLGARHLARLGRKRGESADSRHYEPPPPFQRQLLMSASIRQHAHGGGQRHARNSTACPFNALRSLARPHFVATVSSTLHESISRQVE
jgi:hypothetical protein